METGLWDRVGAAVAVVRQAVAQQLGLGTSPWLRVALGTCSPVGSYLVKTKAQRGASTEQGAGRPQDPHPPFPPPGGAKAQLAHARRLVGAVTPPRPASTREVAPSGRARRGDQRRNDSFGSLMEAMAWAGPTRVGGGAVAREPEGPTGPAHTCLRGAGAVGPQEEGTEGADACDPQGCRALWVHSPFRPWHPPHHASRPAGSG